MLRYVLLMQTVIVIGFIAINGLLVKVSAMIKVLKDWYRILLSDPNSATLFILLTCISLIIYFFTDVLTPILLALGVSYILEWPISVLEKRKLLSRTVSTSLLMFIFFSGLILGSIMLLPSLLEQITNLFRKIPDMVGNLEAYFMQKTKEYPAIVEYIDFTVVADALKMKIAEYSSSLIQDKLPSYLMNITTFITYLIIVPLLSFFMLKDKNELLNSLKGVFPPNLSLATKVWVRMNQELMNYISGKFLHVCIIAVVNFLAFRFFDLNYSTLLGISVGLSVVIPYVGAAIVTIPVAGVALYQFGFNSTFGYRTKRSMMNEDTWKFAHSYIGKLWFICGLILLLPSVVVMFFVFGKEADTVGTIGAILVFIQMFPMIGTIIPTEKALKKNFDDYGRHR